MLHFISSYHPFKSGDGQTTMAVTVPQESNEPKVQSNEEAPRFKRARRARRAEETWPVISDSQGIQVLLSLRS